MRKMKVHKQLQKDSFVTECGLAAHRSARRSNQWRYITCETCLKFRPPFKLKDYLPAPPPADDLDEVFDAAAEEEKTPKRTPFDKWKDWFSLSCDYSFSPVDQEVWDGAIDTVCTYLRNELCSPLGLNETDRILKKVKKKFKNES